MRQIPFGPYVLTERLGEGSMAELWRAQRRGPHGFEKDLVIKRILPDLSGDARFVSMLLQEAGIAGKLDHANIVQVFDAGEIEGEYYIAMEHVRGRDLGAVMERASAMGRPLTPLQSVAIMRAVLDGLHYAHGLRDDSGLVNVVHRDVGPPNILVSYTGEVKLTDFGIARVAAAVSETRPGVLTGRIPYMSPEQARGEPLDRRSDIYSAGVVLWELLAQRPLFDAPAEVELLRRVQAGEVPDLGVVNAELDPALVRMVMRSLAPSPAERYDSAGAFADALEDYVLQSGVKRETISIRRVMQELFPRSPRAVAWGTLRGVRERAQEALARRRQAQPLHGREGDSAPQSPLRSKTLRRWSAVMVVCLGLGIAGVAGWYLRASPDREASTPGEQVEREREVASKPPAEPAARKTNPRGSKGRDRKHTAMKKRPSTGIKPKITETGTLESVMYPWSEVWFKGEKMGTFPYDKVSLPAGKHTVRLMNPRLDLTRDVEVEIIAGRVTTLVGNLRDKVILAKREP